MNEATRLEVLLKKLGGVCDEHNLVYSFQREKYPVSLVIKSTSDVGAQLSMLADAEDEPYSSPDAVLVFYYKDGDLVIRTSERFVIGDALFNKFKNYFRKMYEFWLGWFFRDLITNRALPEGKMPVIDESEDGDDLDDDEEGEEEDDGPGEAELPDDDESGDEEDDDEEDDDADVDP